MGRVLFKNGFVVTVNDRRDVITSGSVLVEDGRISFVGSQPPIGGDDESVAEEIDASGCIVMPGFINAHQHHWYSLLELPMVFCSRTGCTARYFRSPLICQPK